MHANLLPRCLGNMLPRCICCFVLGEYFRLPGLAEECLEHVRRLLMVDDALLLVQFAERIKSQTLRDMCVKFLETHQCS